MATTPVWPSGTNTFVPSTEATNNMVVDFSRKPSEFRMSEWTQYVPVKYKVGRYTKLTVEMAGRLLNSTLQDHAWYDGEDAPTGRGNQESFGFYNYATIRYAFPNVIGEEAADQASWDILASHSRIGAQRAMTARTQIAVTAATTAGNYSSNHTSAVSSISGVTGKWDVSTTARKDIKRSLDYAFSQIHIDTLGAVKPDQVMVVMSPDCARKLSVCQEIVDHIKQSPSAEKELKEGLEPNSFYGLPSKLYGYKIVIEDSVKTTSRKGATVAKSYLLADTTPFMCSRPGALEGVEGAPSFSTHTCFLYKELLVESQFNKNDKRHEMRVVDDHVTVVTADISGFLFTAAVD